MTLRSSAREFVDLVGRWFQQQQRCDLEDLRARPFYAEDDSQLSESVIARMLELHSECNGIAESVCEAGESLAKLFAAKKLDATAVLRVVHFADGGGGLPALAPHWADLKVAILNQSLQATEGGDNLPAEPLSEPLQQVFDLIQTTGPITGKEICKEIPNLTEGTLTRHIIPELKEKRGVKNKRGVGYYLPK